MIEGMSRVVKFGHQQKYNVVCNYTFSPFYCQMQQIISIYQAKNNRDILDQRVRFYRISSSCSQVIYFMNQVQNVTKLNQLAGVFLLLNTQSQKSITKIYKSLKRTQFYPISQNFALKGQCYQPRSQIYNLIYQSQIRMSNSNPNQQGGYGYLINSYGKPSSRFTRSKGTSQDTSLATKPSQSVISQPSLLNPAGKTQTRQSRLEGLVPNKVSDISSNVVFQDIDSPTKSVGRKSVNQQNNESTLNKNKEAKVQVIGLVGKTLLGATTKYTKMSIEQVFTPTKTIESQQKYTPKNSENGGTAMNKLSRKRDAEIQKIEKKSDLALNLNIQGSEKKEESSATDRSNIESGKKIQRKTDRSRRDLKFSEKKQVKQQIQPENYFELSQTSKIRQQTYNKPTEVHYQSEAVNVQAIEPKPYQPIQRQPIQRQNYGSNSRLVTSDLEKNQTPEVKVQTQTKVETQSIANTYSVPTSTYRTQQKSTYFSKVQKQPQQTIPTENKLISTTLPPSEKKSTIYVQESKLPTKNQQRKEQVSIQVVENKPTYARPKLLSNKFDKTSTKIQISQQSASQINLKQNSSAIKVENTEQVPKKQLKKSILFIYLIKRLVHSKVQSSFCILRHKNIDLRRKVTKQNSILAYQALQIQKHKENRLTRWSFDVLKQRFSVSYVSQLKSVLLYKSVNTLQTSLNLLQKIYQSKLRSVFKKIRNKHFWSNNQIKGLNLLDRFTKNKQILINRQVLRHLSLRAKNKSNLLTSFSNMTKNLNKEKVGLAFLKLLSNSKSGPKVASPQKAPTKSFMRQAITPKIEEYPSKNLQPNPALQEKAQKLKAIISSVSDNLAIITKKIKTVQKDSNQQGTQLQQKIAVLKQANQQIQNELSNKKSRISYIKKELKEIDSKAESQPIEDQLQIHDEKLQKLAKIYMGNFKNKDEVVSSAQIFEEYQLNPENCSKSYQQWLLLAANIDLKLQIASYEQVTGTVEFKARKIAVAEQHVAAKLVRSYIKEQYFWEWLHLTAQSMQSK